MMKWLILTYCLKFGDLIQLFSFFCISQDFLYLLYRVIICKSVLFLFSSPLLFFHFCVEERKLIVLGCFDIILSRDGSCGLVLVLIQFAK